MPDETKGDGMTLEQLRFSVAAHLADDDKPALATMRAWLKSLDDHLAAQSAMRVDEAVLDAPARVGAVTFGMGVAWSSVIGCAQRAYNAKPLPRETVEALKRMLSEIQSDAEQAVYGTTNKPQP